MSPVEDSRQPGLFVPPPGGVPLVEALGVVSLPDLGAMDVPEGHREGWRQAPDQHLPEGPLPAAVHPLGPGDGQVGLPHPHEELVILEAPAPVLVTHAVHEGVVLPRCRVVRWYMEVTLVW